MSNDRGMGWIASSLLALALALPALALPVLAAPAAAADTWTVPAAAGPITAEFTGFVEADRSKLTSLMPPGQRLVPIWLMMNGRAVAPGDVVVVFDTQLVERDLPQRRAELAEAEAQYRLNLLKLDSARATLVDQLAQGRADLATARARLAALGTDDAADAALAHTRADQAQAAVQRAERDLARLRVRAAAGDAAAQEVEDAVQAVAQARFAAERAQAAAQRAAAPDHAIERARQALEERRIMGTLGLVRAADGSEHEDPARGLAARLIANQDQRDSQQTALAAERDARRTALHVTERDLHDHCAVGWVELLPAGGEPPLRWDFAPAASPAIDGWRRDDGAPFSATRGWGWDGDRRPDMAAVDPGPAARPEDTWCVVREPAVWTAAVPDGQWRLRVGLGADVDWDGAFVRVDGGDGPRVVHVANRIEAGAHPVAELPVTVHGGRLRLLVGDQPGKHLYATVGGVMTLHPRTERGRKIDWLGRPMAYVAEPAAVRIAARAPADVAPLMTAAGGAAASAAPSGDGLRARTATSTVTILAPGLPPLTGTVTQVGTKPSGIRIGPAGWNEEDQGQPQDLTHREITIAVAPADAARLALRSRVVLRVAAIPPAGIAAVPPWMVVWRASVPWIITAAGWHQVEAARTGPGTLVAGLAPGTVLLTPAGEPPAPAATAKDQTAKEPKGPQAASGRPEDGFPGEVVAGARVRVIQPGGWGRVGTFIPDGSDVKVGDELLTLYNPQIEQQKDQLARARRESERAFADAAAARRERLLASADKRRSDELDEGGARLDLAEARKPADTLAESAIEVRRATAEAAAATRVAQATAALAAPPAADLADRRSAVARSAALADRAALDLARLANQGDWLQALTADGTWAEARAVVGQREADDVVARGEDRAEAAKAAASMAAMDQDQSWVDEFTRNKVLRATAAGRMYWLLAWNDQTRARGKVTKDVWIWGGMPVAEIIDLGKLSFTAELPEALYPRMRAGLAVRVRFPVLGDRRIDGTVAEVGQALGPPRDAASAARDERIADLRVFTLTIDLHLPAADQAGGKGIVQPGLRGILELP